MTLFLIYIIFIISFFGNYFAGLGMIPYEATLIVEIFIYLLFVLSLIVRRHDKYDFHLLPIFVFFVLIFIMSALLNNEYSIRLIYSLRLIFRYYVFYLAIINLGFLDRELKKINILLFILFLIQVPAQIVNFLLHGIRENNIGLMHLNAGGITAIIPIAAIGYLWGYIAYYKKSLLLILLVLGFLFFGIAGNKRVFFVFYPLTFLGIYFLVYIIDKRINFIKHIPTILIFLIFGIGLSLASIKFMPSLNPDREVGGPIDLSYTYEYASNYLFGSNLDQGTGRFGAFINTFNALSKDPGNLLLGLGPGSYTYSLLDIHLHQKRQLIDFGYGKTGFLYIAAEYGLLGALCFIMMYFIFIKKSYKLFRIETDPYWKAFSCGSFIFISYIFIIFLMYNSQPISGDVITPVCYYAMAVTRIRSRNIQT